MGAHGAGVNKIRDSLGVKVDFFDDHEDNKDKEVVKKKKAPTGQKAKVKVWLFVALREIDAEFISQITGRKENVEDAKRRIISQAERYVSYRCLSTLNML